MIETKKYSLFRSFVFALSGIFKAIKKERNIKIHLLVAILVVLAGAIAGLTKVEWLVIVLIIFAIFAAETFNSALEEMCDLLNGKLDLKYDETKLARNISAGAVLFLVFASVIIGLIVFLPRLILLLRSTF